MRFSQVNDEAIGELRISKFTAFSTRNLTVKGHHHPTDTRRILKLKILLSRWVLSKMESIKLVEFAAVWTADCATCY